MSSCKKEMFKRNLEEKKKKKKLNGELGEKIKLEIVQIETQWTPS